MLVMKERKRQTQPDAVVQRRFKSPSMGNPEYEYNELERVPSDGLIDAFSQ